VQHAVDRWGGQAPAAGRAVPAANFHITLHFVGHIEARELELLCAEAARIRMRAFALRLDSCGWFARPGIFYLSPGEVPAALVDLAAATRKATRIAARKAGASSKRPRQSRKRYSPHLTLYRQCRARPPLPAAPPDFTVECDNFTLFESITVTDGVRYQALQSWRAG